MGVIKDGTISGVLPKPHGFLVHYPGYPSSTSRALDTLGGTQGILKARSSQSNRLELRFRPEDPYSHPAFGERRPTNALLLKISKKKFPDADGAEASNSMCGMEHGMEENHVESEDGADDKVDEKENLCADIVAHVPEAYFFEGMADYQYVVPVHADVAKRKKRNWSEPEETILAKDSRIEVDHDDIMIIVPPIFSPKDTPKTTNSISLFIFMLAYPSSNNTLHRPPQRNNFLTNTTTIFLADSTADRCTPSQFTIRRPSRVTTSLRSEQPSPPFSDANCDLQRHPHEASHIAAPCYSRSESDYSSINRPCLSEIESQKPEI